MHNPITNLLQIICIIAVFIPLFVWLCGFTKDDVNQKGEVE